MQLILSHSKKRDCDTTLETTKIHNYGSKNTWVAQVFSWEVGFPKCIVLVISVVPSRYFITNKKIHQWKEDGKATAHRADTNVEVKEFHTSANIGAIIAQVQNAHFSIVPKCNITVWIWTPKKTNVCSVPLTWPPESHKYMESGCISAQVSSLAA